MSATRVRAPFQGVRNVVRFNWPFYAVEATILIVLALLSLSVSGGPRIATLAILTLALAASLISLLVSL